MKAVTWHGKRDVRVDTVADPRIEQPTDAIIERGARGAHGEGGTGRRRQAAEVRGTGVDVTCRCGPDGRAFATHRIPLDDAPSAYEMFQHKQNGALKVLFTG